MIKGSDKTENEEEVKLQPRAQARKTKRHQPLVRPQPCVCRLLWKKMKEERFPREPSEEGEKNDKLVVN